MSCPDKSSIYFPYRRFERVSFSGAKIIRTALTPVLCGDRNAAGEKWIIRTANGHGLSLWSSCADNSSRRKRAVLSADQPRP